MGRRRASKETGARVEENGAEMLLSVPLEAPATGYCTDHVDLRLTRRQAETLDRLTRALHVRGEHVQRRGYDRLPRYVQTPGDALRWLLERIAEEEET